MGRRSKSKKRKSLHQASQPKKKKKAKKQEPFHNPFRARAGELKKKLQKPEPSEPPKRQPSTRHQPDLHPKLDEETALFQKAMQGVAPLCRDKDTVPRGPSSDSLETVRPEMTEEAEVLAQLADLVDGTGSFDISDTTEYIEGIARGLDRRLLKRLRKGEYSVQAHLDLHGMNRKEAKQAVSDFLTESRRTQKRCVLIICGRGHHSKDKQPVLKTHLAHWLVRGRLGRATLAFSSARPCDGGVGAVYVLLRK
jgi:DNA-nicking Smr family endonuclease